MPEKPPFAPLRTATNGRGEIFAVKAQEKERSDRPFSGKFTFRRFKWQR
jgi:hypothetical protein